MFNIFKKREKYSINITEINFKDGTGNEDFEGFKQIGKIFVTANEYHFVIYVGYNPDILRYEAIVFCKESFNIHFKKYLSFDEGKRTIDETFIEPLLKECFYSLISSRR